MLNTLNCVAEPSEREGFAAARCLCGFAYYYFCVIVKDNPTTSKRPENRHHPSPGGGRPWTDKQEGVAAGRVGQRARLERCTREWRCRRAHTVTRARGPRT